MGKKEKILKLKYSLEALEDELEYHVDTIVEKNQEIERLTSAVKDSDALIIKKQARIVELIHENDRLTMAYEPYRPPGDEDEGLTFYGLKDENDSLMQNVLDKIEVINELDREIRDLKTQIYTLQKLATLSNSVPPTRKARSFRLWSR